MVANFDKLLRWSSTGACTHTEATVSICVKLMTAYRLFSFHSMQQCALSKQFLMNCPMVADWSLTGVLNRALTAACPLAKASHVFVEVPNKAFDLHPAPTAMHSGPGAPDIAEYDLKELLRPHGAVDILFSFPEDRRVTGKSHSSKSRTDPWSFVPLTAEKFATGEERFIGKE